MSVEVTSLQEERRKFPRTEAIQRLTVSLLRPHGPVIANSVNISPGGMCLQMQETVEVRSLVRLQVATDGRIAGRLRHPVECTARVAWVVQRLDLREMPPFIFDVGIEFVDPPPMLRQFLVRHTGRLGALRHAVIVHAKSLEPTVVRDCRYVPRLEHTTGPLRRWHLVVCVDGAPCFSGHYASERAALMAWAKFKRDQANRTSRHLT